MDNNKDLRDDEKVQKVYFSKAHDPSSFTTDMTELEYLDMFITCDLQHLTEVESKWRRND